ncbi:MAG: acyltransferase [Candidatus Thermoplasmatota archaeon]|nr:acyltransferase [Candidatus Thermoplasmatota archaeon]
MSGIASGAQQKGKAWTPEMEYLRGFAILCVVLVHSLYPYHNVESVKLNALVAVNVFLEAFAFAGVPIFIFVSGFTLYSQYHGKFSLANFYKKRLKSTIPQYVIFSVLYIFFDHWKAGGTPITFREVLSKIVNFEAHSHLWFFSLILMIYLLYPVLVKLYGFCAGKRCGWVLVALFLATSIVWWTLLRDFQASNHLPGTWLGVNLDRLTYYLFYFVLGMHLARNSGQFSAFAKKNSNACACGCISSAQSRMRTFPFHADCARKAFRFHPTGQLVRLLCVASGILLLANRFVLQSFVMPFRRRGRNCPRYLVTWKILIWHIPDTRFLS